MNDIFHSAEFAYLTYSKYDAYLFSICHGTMLEINRTHHEKFHEWFKSHVAQLIANGEDVSKEIKTLDNGPFLATRKCNSYTIDGYHFPKKSYDEGRPTQSSGVTVVSQIMSSSCEDSENLMVRNKIYYGMITEILELNYNNKGSIVLFKCDWVDNCLEDKWVQVDDLGVTRVNFKHLLKSDEPFTLASQANQVYYVQDGLDKDWCFVRSSPHP